MADILALRNEETPEAPVERKGSAQSDLVCHNSGASACACLRF